MMSAKIVMFLFLLGVHFNATSKTLQICNYRGESKEYLGEIVGHSLRRGLLVVELIVHGVALIGHLS